MFAEQRLELIQGDDERDQANESDAALQEQAGYPVTSDVFHAHQGGHNGTVASAGELLSYDFYKHSLASAAVEFAVEDLLPRAEVEFACGDGDDYFPAHELGV